ncbi:phytanoyl-CoA dioxygenase family protein [Ilumatobacter sp.]|uniref:phytanoyl-CoA dioxygenase family protein n=1 Tax=Ilumatobacter sp. TaxID=1967498 RepID=UPI003AF6C108
MAAQSETLVERYRRDGFVCPIDALTADEAGSFRAALEASEAAAGGSLGRHTHKPHLVDGWAQELVRHPAILDVVEQIIGPDILVWESVLFIKEAGTDDFISWHQDITYWGLEQEGDVVTAWVALSPSVAESGCMSVVPGSHRRTVEAHRETENADNMLSRGQELAVDISAETTADLELMSGQMSLHHVKLFHGSQPNESADRRIGCAIRFLPPHVRQETDTRDSATLVRGDDRFGNFELEPAPTTDLAPDAVALHKELGKRRAGDG